MAFLKCPLQRIKELPCLGRGFGAINLKFQAKTTAADDVDTDGNSSTMLMLMMMMDRLTPSIII